MISRRGICLVVSAPSGAGKSSVTRALLASETRLSLSVSATTRAPRAGEREGVHYFFRSQPQFDVMIAGDELLEWASVFGRTYGTPRAPVEAALAAGRDVLFDIDWQGHRQIRAALPADTVGLFLLPPSHHELDARLRRRGDDAVEITRRMDAARAEMSHAGEFDYVVVNHVFEEAVAEVRAILHAARCAVSRQAGLAGFVSELS